MDYCRRCGHLQARHGVTDHGGPCKVCGCGDYEPLGAVVPDSVDDGLTPAERTRRIAEGEIYPALKRWAHSYNAYERIAGEKWGELMEPIWQRIRELGQIPDWLGVDLIRACAFYQARSHNHACMNDSSYSCCSVIYDLAVAVQNHKAARPDDLPPPIPAILLERNSGR